VGGQGVAVHALGFFGVPLDKTQAVIDFAPGFGEALAVFAAQQFGKGFLVSLNGVVPAAQDLAALLGERRRPFRERRAGAVDRRFDLSRGVLGNAADFFTGGGVVDDKHEGISEG